MPRVKATRAAAIAAAQGVEPEITDTKSDLPTPEEQKEANEIKTHTIKLLDGTTVELKMDFTVDDLLRRRLDAKILAFSLAVRPAVEAYGNVPFVQAFVAEISANDMLYTKAIDLLANLTREPLQRFFENIGSDQLGTAVLKALEMVTAVKKAATEKTKKKS